jgi:hypothetical protein
MGRPKAGVPWTLPTPERATGDIDLGGVPSASRGAKEIANRSGSEPIAASGRALVQPAAAVAATSRPRLFEAAAVPTVSLLVKFFQGINVDTYQPSRFNRQNRFRTATSYISFQKITLYSCYFILYHFAVARRCIRRNKGRS